MFAGRHPMSLASKWKWRIGDGGGTSHNIPSHHLGLFAGHMDLKCILWDLLCKTLYCVYVFSNLKYTFAL